MPTCDCCWCCKYAHGAECDNWCRASERATECDCREEDYRTLIEGEQ